MRDSGEPRESLNQKSRVRSTRRQEKWTKVCWEVDSRWNLNYPFSDGLCSCSSVIGSYSGAIRNCRGAVRGCSGAIRKCRGAISSCRAGLRSGSAGLHTGSNVPAGKPDRPRQGEYLVVSAIVRVIGRRFQGQTAGQLQQPAHCLNGTSQTLQQPCSANIFDCRCE
jgi:hypothetical protein